MYVVQLLTRILYAGITEVQIIQWYVEEGAHIEEWKPLCQYQSDKAVDDVSELSSIPLFTYLTIYESDNFEIRRSSQEAPLSGR
jgi:hypothetical protein